MNQQRPSFLLFFSKQCGHSCDFLKALSSIPDLYNKFQKIDVQTRNIRLPNYVNEVPTIVVPGQNKSQMYVGDDVFRWLDNFMQRQRSSQTRQPQHQQQQQQQRVGLNAFDPGNFSGSFADINDNQLTGNGTSGGSFSPLDNQDYGFPKNVPGDGNNPGGSGSKSEQSTVALDQLRAQRDKEIPQAQSRVGGDGGGDGGSPNFQDSNWNKGGGL